MGVLPVALPASGFRGLIVGYYVERGRVQLDHHDPEGWGKEREHLGSLLGEQSG